MAGYENRGVERKEVARPGYLEGLQVGCITGSSRIHRLAISPPGRQEIDLPWDMDARVPRHGHSGTLLFNLGKSDTLTFLKPGPSCGGGRTRPLYQLPAGVSRDRARGAIVSLVHNASLIIDDILDQSATRRGQRAVSTCPMAAPWLPAWPGWMNFAALEAARYAPGQVQILSRMLAAVVEGEAAQQHARFLPRPIPLDTWERIARLDTGGLFQLATDLGGMGPAHDHRTIHHLAYLYHGLDDIGDLLDNGPSKGGAKADLRDNIPTLLHCSRPASAEAH